MADPIKLPPLPPHPEICHVWSDKQKEALRARDLEVARVVLEAAADACEQYQGGSERTAKMIRALEFTHG